MTSSIPPSPRFLEAINRRPLETLHNLHEAFGRNTATCVGVSRIVPVGIEIEVPWKAYFPDLWSEDFHTLSEERMAEITEECTRREAVLLPKLRKTIECGIKRGCDRYWEFALDPVTDISLIVNQVAVLRQAGLIPGDSNSLHITFGGLRVSRYSYYVALVMEALSVTPERVRSANYTTTSSKGWARKGKAGVFEKEGSYDMMHDYNYGTEIRMAQLPERNSRLALMLDISQRMAVEMYHIQCGVLTTKHQFDSFISELATVLFRAGLPDRNWGNPHTEPDIWDLYAHKLPEMRQPIINVLRKFGYAHEGTL